MKTPHTGDRGTRKRPAISDPVVLSHTDRYIQYMSSHSVTERASIVNISDLIGFVFFASPTRLEFLQFPAIHNDAVTGVLHAGSPSPELVSIELVSFFKDCLLWVPSEAVIQLPGVFHTGPGMTRQHLQLVHLGPMGSEEGLLDLEQSGDLVSPPTFPNRDTSCICGLPRAFPLFRGHPFKEGDIAMTPIPSGDVIILWQYFWMIGFAVDETFCNLAGFKLFALWNLPSDDMVLQCTRNPIISFEYLVSGSPSFTQISDRLPVGIITKRSRSVVLSNTPQRLRRPPVLRVDDDPVVLPTLPSTAQDAFQPGIPPDITFKDAYINFSLLFSILEIDHNQNVIHIRPPTFTPSFLAGLRSESKNDALFGFVKRSYQSVLKELRHSRHYLSRFVDPTAFEPSSVMLGFFTGAQILSRSFQDLVTTKELEKVLTLAAFATPKRHTQAYRDYVERVDNNKLDALAGQHKEKADAVVTKLFALTQFDRSIEDVLTAVAQFLAFSQTIVQLRWDEDDEDNPTIVRLLLDLAHLASDKALGVTFSKSESRMPWIYHNLFLAFHNVFQQGCLLLLSSDATHAVRTTSIESVPPDAYQPMLLAFAQLKRDLTLMGSQRSVCADSFRAEPDSWTTVGSGYSRGDLKKFDPVSDGRGSSNTKIGQQSGQPGWLKIVDPSKHPRDFLPKLKERICSYYCFEGYVCGKSTCLYKHISGLDKLSKSDQEILTAFIADNPGYQIIQSQSKKTGVSKKNVIVSQD